MTVYLNSLLFCFVLFWFSMYLPILLSLSGSCRIYIPPTTPIHLGWQLGWPAGSVSCLRITSIVIPAPVASCVITNWFSSNPLNGLRVPTVFFTWSRISSLCLLTDLIHLGLSSEVGLIGFYSMVLICNLQLKNVTFNSRFSKFDLICGFRARHWSCFISSRLSFSSLSSFSSWTRIMMFLFLSLLVFQVWFKG